MNLQQICNGNGFRFEGGDIAKFPNHIDIVTVRAKHNSLLDRGFKASAYLFEQDSTYCTRGVIVYKANYEITLVTYTRYTDEETPVVLPEDAEILFQWEQEVQ